MILHLPGGILAERIGGKPVIVSALIVSAILSALTPSIVNAGGASALIALRMCLGCVQAGFFPAVATMLSKWVPTNERGRIGSLVYCGLPVGRGRRRVFTAVHRSQLTNVYSFAVRRNRWKLHGRRSYARHAKLARRVLHWRWGRRHSGPIICKPNLNTGGLTMTTLKCGSRIFQLQALICTNCPSTHPFISDEEKHFLRKQISQARCRDERPVATPWKAILTSSPVLALIAAEVGYVAISIAAGLLLLYFAAGLSASFLSL